MHHNLLIYKLRRIHLLLQDKAVVDKLMEQLQRTDATYHLRSDSGSNAAGSGRDYGSYIDPRLFGAWELLYASNGEHRSVAWQQVAA